jgi:hypothetical protein
MTEEAPLITPQLVKDALVGKVDSPNALFVSQLLEEMKLRITRETVKQALFESRGEACFFQLLAKLPSCMRMEDLVDTPLVTGYLRGLVDNSAYAWDVNSHRNTTKCLFWELSLWPVEGSHPPPPSGNCTDFLNSIFYRRTV